jgi:protein-arginine kinase activator protein McsA
MKRMYLLSSLFDEFFNSNWEVNKFPKDDDVNFNKKVEEIETNTHTIKNETWTSLDGKTVYKKQIVESKTKTHHKSIEELKSEMKLAVDNEDFEKAAQIRDLIKSCNN